MMMTLLRQGRAHSHLDHLACMDLASSREEMDMITWSFLNEKPALVGLEKQTTIIKPAEEGDDAVSFEALLDTALSLREFRRLKAHKVTDVTQIGDVLYRVNLVAEFPFHPRVSCLIRAKDEIEFKKKLPRLLEDDEFKRALTEALFTSIFTSDETHLVTSGPLKVNDPAPADAPEFEFLTHPET